MSEESSQSRTALFKETLRVARPAVLESFFVALAGMIDTLMVSTMGSSSVAAVGLTNQPKLLVLALFLSANIAVSALVARRRGEERQDMANEILLTALVYTLVVCAVMTIACLLFAGQVMRFCGSAPDTHQDAVLYFRIIMGGMFFNVVSLCINAAQRGSGNTRIAMTTNVTSSIVNVCFNYALIGGHFGFPALGITGAALATVLGTVVACIMSIASLFRPDSFMSLSMILREKLHPTLDAFFGILRLASNILVENVAMRIGFMATAVMAAGLGTDAFAAHQVGMNFLSLGFAFGDGMQASAVALIGRSLGEKDPDKAKSYGSICQKVGLVMSLCLSAVILLGGRFIYGLYFAEPHIIEMGVLICRFIMVILLCQISQVIFTGCLRGAGDVRYTLFASMFSATLVRPSVIWVLLHIFHWGLSGIWVGILLDQFSRLVLMGIRFYQGKWTELKI